MLKKISHGGFALLFILLASQACGNSGSAPALVFEDAWVRAMPPGVRMTAAYGTFGNPGETAVELTAWTSPQFGDVSLHRTERVDGVSKMISMERLEVPAGGQIELAPGGLHLMLMMPGGDIGVLEQVTVRAETADGRSFEFVLPVEPR